jgi:hypothetical protein
VLAELEPPALEVLCAAVQVSDHDGMSNDDAIHGYMSNDDMSNDGVG